MNFISKYRQPALDELTIVSEFQELQVPIKTNISKYDFRNKKIGLQNIQILSSYSNQVTEINCIKTFGGGKHHTESIKCIEHV